MEVIQLLKESGYRLTKQRSEILKVLADYPLSACEIQKKIGKNNMSIDLASVYRTLDVLVKLGVVRVVDFYEDKKRYERFDNNNHHHHLVCTQCKGIEDVCADEQTFMDKIQSSSKFKITSHTIEFFGVCSTCQKSQTSKKI